MSTYLEDFGSYTADSAPTGWTDRLDTDWTNTVRAGSLVFGDQYLEVNPGTTSARRLYSYDAVDGDANRANAEVLFRFKKSSGFYEPWMIGAAVRGSGSSGAESMYVATLNNDDLVLSKIVSTTWTQLAVFNDIITSFAVRDEWHWLRLRANGTSIQAKVWPESRPEPPYWHVEATDSAVSGVGWSGVWQYDDIGSANLLVDYFGVGTNGDTVSLPVEATAQVNLNQEVLDVLRSGNEQVNLNQGVLDVLRGGNEQVNLNQEVLDVLRGGNEQVNLNQAVLDVLRGPTPLPPPPVQSMETLMLESFETYSTSTSMLRDGFRWAGYTGAFAPGFNSTGGRDGKKALELTNSASNYSIYTELRKAVRTLVVGFAVRWDTLPDTADEGPLYVKAGLRGVDSAQLSLTLNPSGKLELYRGDVGTGTKLGTGTKAFQAQTWYYIECRIYIDNTSGSYEVRVDETLDLSGTSVDTQNHATDNTARTIFLHSGKAATASGGDKALFDDVYMRGHPTDDVAGGFLGNIIIDAVMPNANGTYRQWTLSTGTDEYALIDEQPASDADYLYSSTSGARVTLGMEDLTGTDAVVSVMAYHHTSGKVGGMRELKPFCRNGGNHADDGTQLCREEAYLWGAHFPYDPATNLAWSISGINAAEFGIEAV
ncbi:MAG: hypothetical protein U9Q19_02680 [Pseudomonadota bacterium]|nr:hypothetical protein [Pseudomonadota bacterium]